MEENVENKMGRENTTYRSIKKSRGKLKNHSSEQEKLDRTPNV